MGDRQLKRFAYMAVMKGSCLLSKTQGQRPKLLTSDILLREDGLAAYGACKSQSVSPSTFQLMTTPLMATILTQSLTYAISLNPRLVN